MTEQMPPLPETLEECHQTLTSIWKYMQRSHLYIGDMLWQEGHWFYRDRENDKLFLVCGRLRQGLPVAIVTRERGIVLMGTTGPEDPIQRGHAQGVEIIRIHDAMGDFQSIPERITASRPYEDNFGALDANRAGQR